VTSAISWPISTVSSALIFHALNVPANDASIGYTALSVSTSHSTSSWLTLSPGCLCSATTRAERRPSP